MTLRDKRIRDKGFAAGAAMAAALALLFAGSAAFVLATALDLSVPALPLYLAALVSVALCAVGTLSTAGAVGASLAFVVAVGLYLVTHIPGLGALRALFAAWAGQPGEAELVALGGRTFLTCAAFTMGALFFALLSRREFIGVAILLLLSVVVSCHAMSETASLPAAVPGLIAAAAAFALTGGVQLDAAALRTLLPAALAVAIALALVPAGRVTWPPLEEAAERVRGVFEQYFHFTQERIAFSISEEGYDHAGEVGDSVISMLGGPAEPHTDPVMSVHTDADVLLRGAIRTAYTGYSWVDAAPKSRYLYYDLTHRATRDRVFTPGGALKDALLSVDMSVEMLDEGTSTLFVPGLLEKFDMDLSTAVYYNTAGEMFLSRPVQVGDRYALRAMLPEMNDALRQAVIRGEATDDDRYQDVMEDHIQLPEGIDGGVYALTMRVIDGADNAYDRAAAILNYLRGNMRYTLQPEMPPRGRDFVSHFLLDTQRGYCSYYATAMAVMARIAGLPSRYVEGYLARPGQEVLTGENAHAWAEIYFRGVGWIPFDATGGTTGSGTSPEGGAPQGDDGTDAEGDGATQGEGNYDPSGGEPTPTPSPEPDGDAQNEPEDEPTPDPGEGEPEPDDAPEDAPDEGESDLPGEAPGRGGGPWWLLLLLLAALVALAVRWVRKRLRQSDPVALCGQCRSYRQAAMILYRANLTVLSHLGQTPAGGETPEAFAQRVSEQLKNTDYADFVQAVSNARYGRRILRREELEAGLRAYQGFEKVLGRRERLRFTLTRIRRGLGDFEAIP